MKNLRYLFALLIIFFNLNILLAEAPPAAQTFKTEQNYEVLDQPVARSWNYESVTNRYLNTADNLRAAMTVNPYLKYFSRADILIWLRQQPARNTSSDISTLSLNLKKT